MGLCSENTPMSYHEILQSHEIWVLSLRTDLLHKSHSTPVPCPTKHNFVTEMCTCVHISVRKIIYCGIFLWCILFGTCGIPDYKIHGAHLGPTGPRWTPCWPHELCYLGWFYCPGIWQPVRQRCFIHHCYHTDSLVQGCSISTALGMEILQSFAKP